MALLIVLFIVVPIAEIYVIVQVGELIGVVPTLILLLADALLGSLLLKHQGRGAWRRFNEALAQRRFPGREVVDGLLIVVGGTLARTGEPLLTGIRDALTRNLSPVMNHTPEVVPGKLGTTAEALGAVILAGHAAAPLQS